MRIIEAQCIRDWYSYCDETLKSILQKSNRWSHIVLALGLLGEGSKGTVVLSLHPDMLTLLLLSPVLPGLQVSLHRVSAASGTLLAPWLLPFFPEPTASLTSWVCFSHNTTSLFLRVFVTRQLQRTGHLMGLNLFKHIFVSFLSHLHQFHLLTNLLGILSYIPNLSCIGRGP